MPDRPYLANLYGERMAAPVLRSVRRLPAGSGLPCSLSSAGLGSNVSTWLGPPFMKRNTQCFALAGKCGGFEASGNPAAFALLSKNPLLDSKSISASPAKPPPTCHRNSRRVLPHGVGLGI